MKKDQLGLDLFVDDPDTLFGATVPGRAPAPPAPPTATIGACPTCGASTRYEAEDHRCDRCRDLRAYAGELPVDERTAHRAQCVGALMAPIFGGTPTCNVCDWSPGQPLPDPEEGT